MKARVIVRLKSAVHDPQGEAIKKALHQMDIAEIASVRQGKFFELSLDVGSREEAERIVTKVSEQVLSNPILEIFQFELEDSPANA